MTEQQNERLKDRFSKWQAKTNVQFGYFNNLLLVLATATLGFSMNFMIENDFCYCNLIPNILFATGIFLTIISIITGTFLGYNRLIDFRKTSQKLLARIKKYDEEIKILEEQTDYLGKCSWNLLKAQLSTFLVGSLIIAFYFAYLYI